MNKYQEAFANVKQCNCKDCTCNDMKLIEELVERAIPKKVTDVHVDEFYCPNCGSEITHDHDCELPNFCNVCAQRLK